MLLYYFIIVVNVVVAETVRIGRVMRIIGQLASVEPIRVNTLSGGGNP